MALKSAGTSALAAVAFTGRFAVCATRRQASAVAAGRAIRGRTAAVLAVGLMEARASARFAKRSRLAVAVADAVCMGLTANVGIFVSACSVIAVVVAARVAAKPAALEPTALAAGLRLMVAAAGVGVVSACLGALASAASSTCRLVRPASAC